MRKVLRVLLLASLVAPMLVTSALAGYNATAPRRVRRIFTQIAFAEGRLTSYQVLEPGPPGIQAFPIDHEIGKLFRFPGCALAPVLDDSAVPSPDVNRLIPDRAMREVVDVELSTCVQPTSEAQVRSLAVSQRSIGLVNAPTVPAPLGTDVPAEEQQSEDELWGPVPDPGVVDPFAGRDLWPQQVQGITRAGVPVRMVQQPIVRRPRIRAYAGERVVYFVTYETKGLAESGLVDRAIETQWARTKFPGEADLFFLAYGRAPLPPNAGLPHGSVDSNGVPNDNQAVLNVVGGAPFWAPGEYSPLWKMYCLDGGITPPIGPGEPCGDTRFYQVEIGNQQPQTVSEVRATGLPIVNGILRNIDCPVIATDVDDDGVFADAPGSPELVRFPDVSW
jgi:hypothetical protein